MKQRLLESEIQNTLMEKQQYLQLKNRQKTYQTELEKEMFERRKQLDERDEILSNKVKEIAKYRKKIFI